MLRFVNLFFLYLFISFQLHAQLSPGAVNSSTAFSDLSGYKNKFTLFTNPAGLGLFNHSFAGVFYSPAPFELKELATTSFVANYNSKFGNFSVAYLRYGYELYSENNILLAHGREVFNKLFVGITTEFRTVSIENYGNTSAFNMIIGLTWFVLPQLSIATAVNNPFGFEYSNSSEKLESGVSLGASYLLSDLAKISAMIQNETDRETSFGYGLELFIHDNITIRGGNNNQLNMFTLGAGLNYHSLGINYSVLIHDFLGYTHQAEIYAEF